MNTNLTMMQNGFKFCYKQLTKFHKTKKREATRYSFSFVRPSHCPVNRTSNTEAHAVCICCTKSWLNLSKRSNTESYGYNIPIRHPRCIALDLQWKVAKFHEVKKQARKRYFIMYSIPIPFTLVGLRSLETRCKFNNSHQKKKAKKQKNVKNRQKKCKNTSF